MIFSRRCNLSKVSSLYLKQNDNNKKILDEYGRIELLPESHLPRLA
jgi:hypothetical protein